MDVITSYYSNFDIYTDQVGRMAEVGQGERVVLHFTEPYTGSGRNITAENFFISLSDPPFFILHTD